MTEDSLFARAHASRALALLLVPFYTQQPLESLLAPAEASARRSLDLDPQLADGYLAMAGVYRLRWKWADALRAFGVALQLDPRNVPALLNYSQLLYAAGNAEASLEQAQRAAELDPNSALALLGEARALTLFGRHQEGKALIERALELDPALPQTRVYQAMAYLRLGDSSRALAIVDSVQLVPATVAEAAYVVGAVGNRSRARADIRRLEALAQPGSFRNAAVALSYLGMGDTSRALDAFQGMASHHELFPLTIGFVDPIYDPLRSSPRFAAIVRSYGLDDRRFANVSLSKSVHYVR